MMESPMILTRLFSAINIRKSNILEESFNLQIDTYNMYIALNYKRSYILFAIRTFLSGPVEHNLAKFQKQTL